MVPVLDASEHVTVYHSTHPFAECIGCRIPNLRGERGQRLARRATRQEDDTPGGRPVRRVTGQESDRPGGRPARRASGAASPAGNPNRRWSICIYSASTPPPDSPFRHPILELPPNAVHSLQIWSPELVSLLGTMPFAKVVPKGGSIVIRARGDWSFHLYAHRI